MSHLPPKPLGIHWYRDSVSPLFPSEFSTGILFYIFLSRLTSAFFSFIPCDCFLDSFYFWRYCTVFYGFMRPMSHLTLVTFDIGLIELFKSRIRWKRLE